MRTLDPPIPPFQVTAVQRRTPHALPCATHNPGSVQKLPRNMLPLTNGSLLPQLLFHELAWRPPCPFPDPYPFLTIPPNLPLKFPTRLRAHPLHIRHSEFVEQCSPSRLANTLRNWNPPVHPFPSKKIMPQHHPFFYGRCASSQSIFPFTPPFAACKKTFFPSFPFPGSAPQKQCVPFLYFFGKKERKIVPLLRHGLFTAVNGVACVPIRGPRIPAMGELRQGERSVGVQGGVAQFTPEAGASQQRPSGRGPCPCAPSACGAGAPRSSAEPWGSVPGSGGRRRRPRWRPCLPPQGVGAPWHAPWGGASGPCPCPGQGTPHRTQCQHHCRGPGACRGAGVQGPAPACPRHRSRPACGGHAPSDPP